MIRRVRFRFETRPKVCQVFGERSLAGHFKRINVAGKLTASAFDQISEHRRGGIAVIAQSDANGTPFADSILAPKRVRPFAFANRSRCPFLDSFALCIHEASDDRSKEGSHVETFLRTPPAGRSRFSGRESASGGKGRTRNYFFLGFASRLRSEAMAWSILATVRGEAVCLPDSNREIVSCRMPDSSASRSWLSPADLRSRIRLRASEMRV